MPTSNHKTHKYRRVRMSKKYAVMRCILPDCPHYINEKLAIGRRSICNQCEGEFIMDKKALRMKPRCPVCRGDAIVTSKVPDIDFNELLSELAADEENDA